jgi:hypothetical protein
MYMKAFVFAALVLTACGSTKTEIEKDCLGSSTMCGDTCVDIQADQNNCGTCGTVCGDNERCTAGACTTAVNPMTCPTGQMTCGDVCTDTNVDRDHCGACDNACGPDQVCSAGACETRIWEQLAPLPAFLGLQEYIPAGATTIYAQLDGTMYSYTLPAGANTLGTWATLSAAPDTLSDFGTQVLVGATYYELDGTSMYAYDPGTDMWSTPINGTLTHTLNDAESTLDDDGNIYAWSTDQYLVKVHVADNTVTYIQGPVDLPHSEPRVAWDSQTKRVYLGDYSDGTDTIYSFDPVTSMFTKLADFPDAAGLSDGFCSDHHGHIFTNNSDCSTSTDVWMYTEATDTWSELPWLPWEHGCNVSCSVSADGYLYLANANSADHLFARLKI